MCAIYNLANEQTLTCANLNMKTVSVKWFLLVSFVFLYFLQYNTLHHPSACRYNIALGNYGFVVNVFIA